MNKDWIGNSKSTYVTLGASNHTDKERETHDYYSTDSVAIDVLLAGGENFRIKYGSQLAAKDIYQDGLRN